MEKASLKKFAVDARRKLIEDVKFQLGCMALRKTAFWSRRPARTVQLILTLATAIRRPSRVSAM